LVFSQSESSILAIFQAVLLTPGEQDLFNALRILPKSTSFNYYKTRLFLGFTYFRF